MSTDTHEYAQAHTHTDFFFHIYTIYSAHAQGEDPGGSFTLSSVNYQALISACHLYKKQNSSLKVPGIKLNLHISIS